MKSIRIFNTFRVFQFKKHLLCLSFLVFSFSTSALYAQDENYNSDTSSYGGEDGYSEGSSDDYGGSYGSYGSYGSSKPEKVTPKKVVKKPYVRFIPPYDSTLEMIVYQAIIEVVDRDGYEVEIDTIYGRAQKWLAAEFGKDLKKVTAQNGINEKAGEMEYKIKVLADFPCVIEPNEFTKFTSGTVKYEMEIRVRDGRYRYAVKNLVHIADPRPGEKEGVKTYFEYLMKTKNDVKDSDQVLIAADKKINLMMSELKKACNTAPIEEDDEW